MRIYFYNPNNDSGPPLGPEAIANALASLSQQEVYDVVEPAASALERLRHLGGFGAGPALELKHALTVRSPLFNNGALNDVVEGDGDVPMEV